MNIYVTTISPITRTVTKNGKSKQVDISFCGCSSPVAKSTKAVGAKWVQVNIKDDDMDFEKIENKIWEAANSTVKNPNQPLILCIQANKYYEETVLTPSDDSHAPIIDFIEHNFSRR